MPETHTIAEVAADETLLRRLAGEVLNPGPWRHFWVCGHDPTRPYCCLLCDEKKSLQNRDTNCPAIKTPSGSLPDIASQLVQRCNQKVSKNELPRTCIGTACERYLLSKARGSSVVPVASEWFAWTATPSEQAACLLAVMLPEKVR
jgi:hypothetical protein